ncbi:MAG: HNH endonuclease [Nanoarchaeota archaeon]|nr:HNH endonuclease [Nanoarchaeota archaeon]
MDNLENNKRFKEWRKNYRKRPDIKEKIRILAVTKYKERIREYDKEYRKRPEIKSRINTKERMRRKTDMKFAIINRLRRSLNHALTKYSKTGKIMGSKKYGINWGKVIKGLKPFPVSVKKYEIDHIKPLHSFNLDNRKEIKKTFDPSNLQWLTIEENRVKSGKIIESSGGNRKFPTNA